MHVGHVAMWTVDARRNRGCNVQRVWFLQSAIRLP